MRFLPVFNQPITAPVSLETGQTLFLTGDELARLRFRQVRGGESFTLRDAKGLYFRARVTSYEAARAWIYVFEAFRMSPEPDIEITLLQAVPARERMLWIIQKAAELGAIRIVPLLTDRSLSAPEDLAKEKIHRWPAAILKAVRQCRRATVPEIFPPHTLSQALALPLWQEADLRWLLDDAGGEKISPLIQPVHRAVLAVGPEGGWSPPERALFEAAGGIRVCLGGRVLRTETAALVGLTLMGYGRI